jgi:predicted peptidase
MFVGLGFHGPLKVVEKGPDGPGLPAEVLKSFIIVNPQCQDSPDSWANHIEHLALLLGEVSAMPTLSVDPAAIYLTGVSMGGVGTWALAAAYPNLFAAIVPICGGVLFHTSGNYETMTPAERRALPVVQAADMIGLIDMPCYIFHGARDGGAQGSLTAYDALTAAATDAGRPSLVRMAVYPQTEDTHHTRSSFHDSWTQTYEHRGLYEWLLGQRRTDTHTVASNGLARGSKL